MKSLIGGKGRATPTRKRSTMYREYLEYRERRATQMKAGIFNRDEQTHPLGQALNMDLQKAKPLVKKRRPNTAEQVATTEVLVDLDTVRFNGKEDYMTWMNRMVAYVIPTDIRYVLREPCPRVVVETEASLEEISQSKDARERWKKDDSLCFHTILHHLCDDLFCHYSKKEKTTAKQLLEELYSRFGKLESRVKDYLEFQILEEEPLVEQVENFNSIRFEVVHLSKMKVDVEFHVRAIISKLPASWEDVCIELMREEDLPLRKLMDRLRVEEASRIKEKEAVIINNNQ